MFEVNAESSIFLDPSSLERKRAELFRHYQDSSAQDQFILQMVSIIYEATSRTALLACLNDVQSPKTKKTRLTSAKIRSSITTLVNHELLIEEDKKLRCHPLVIELVTRDTIAIGIFEAMTSAVETHLPLKPNWYTQSNLAKREQQLIRAFRIQFYQRNFSGINALCRDYYRYNYGISEYLSIDLLLELVCNNPFDPEWFHTIPNELADAFLVNALLADSLTLTPAENKLECLQEICEDLSGEFLNVALAEQLMLRGRFEIVADYLPELSPEYEAEALAIEGWLKFLAGDYLTAIPQYQKALRILKKDIGSRSVYLQSISGIFYVLALIKDGSFTSLTEAIRYTSLIAEEDDHWLLPIYKLLLKVLKIQTGDLSYRDQVINTLVMPYQSGHSLVTLLSALCVHWVDASPAKQTLIEVLGPFCQQAYQAGYTWLAAESAALISQLALPPSKLPDCIEEIALPSAPMATLLSAKEAWQLSLQALKQLNPEWGQGTGVGECFRLAWFVTWDAKSILLEPKEQKRNAKGVWSKGRKIALSRLCNQRKKFDYLTAQDQQVCTQLESFDIYNYGYPKTEYRFTDRAIVYLVGHPAVFWAEAPNAHIEIVKGEPELLVKDTLQGQLILELSPQLPRGRDVMVIKETPTRLKIIEIHASHRRIREIIGPQNQLCVPATAKTEVLSAVNAISGIVTIHSDIGGSTVDAEIVPTQSIPHVHLLPEGDGLKVALRVRPFAPVGPYFQSGMGGKTVMAEIDGKRLQTNRDLEEEQTLTQGVVKACSTLGRYEEHQGEWSIIEIEDCLELLSDLQELKDEVVLEWPEGEKFRIRHHADLSHLQLRINREQDWFEVRGELNLGESQVLDIQHLLDLLENKPSRFVQLADGQFLALTQSFRKRLEELRSFSDSQGQDRRFHPLASLALEDLIDEVGDLQVDRHWKAHVKRLKASESLDPKLPSTLQAELRDYQMEGFVWLARLSHWGVGACLADDMGLGKTIQALAVILTRAPNGPTLVVAPTSVGMNWMSETEKFAPTLRPIQLGNLVGTAIQKKRAELLDTLEPFDLVVCSYGLLQQKEVAKLLAQVEWETIVLDEAQAIKNFATQRSKAAMTLRGQFKLITTGTPIENHLGELWNLFRFINPGLLGSLEQFNHKYAYLIERAQDLPTRNRLKKLIQPFILRRTKTQVLEELPPRTEIVLQVELSQEEMAFYEALRREALKKLEESDAEAGQKHLQVLAELMKLRRACCNSRLVLPQSDTPSSKLRVFGEVLEELLENHHKVLVFSQFVDHLHLLRDFLEEHQYSYQYLDGSTPAKRRKERVDAFQAGEGDVFLISLKAGGTGLNLTAADYVIHMDPWWNPAVEDQASDRAHRIGQQRPVTIYRLVAQHTIEEKIVELHQHKRDLADRLLEGTDVSGKISTSELLQLMQGSRD